ncbi:MAG: hypothetical protein AAGB26_00440 [Planctomycetota bacterium]
MNDTYLVIFAVIAIAIGAFAVGFLKYESKAKQNSIESIKDDFLQKESYLRVNYQQKVNGEKEELEFVVEWPELHAAVDLKEFSHGWFVIRPMTVNARLLDDAEQRWVPDQCHAVYIKLPSREWRASGFIIRSGDRVNPEKEARALLKQAFDGLPINGNKNGS